MEKVTKELSMKRFQVFAWGFIGYTLLVIVWGAYVRATGSGAGCGNHWPLCNGEVIPRAEQLETLIEFTHRLTSGLALILTIGLLVWAFRSFPTGSRVRTFASLTTLFMLTEALLGAGLVLFGLVADDDSVARAWVMAFHLVNTCFLLACATLTAWNAGDLRVVRIPRVRRTKTLLIAALVGTLLLAASGAVAALGDTLFPVETFSEGLSDDFSAEAHLLVRLRIYHPMLAVIVSLLVLGAAFACRQSGDAGAARIGILTGLLFLAQLAVGTFNLLLLAPVWLQMVHLLVADLAWISLVLLASLMLQRRAPSAWLTTTSQEAARV